MGQTIDQHSQAKEQSEKEDIMIKQITKNSENKLTHLMCTELAMQLHLLPQELFHQKNLRREGLKLNEKVHHMIIHRIQYLTHKFMRSLS